MQDVTNGHRHGPPPGHGPPGHGLAGHSDDMPDWAARVGKWRDRGDGEPLRRHPDDQLAGGVAAGLAAWRGFSPTTVRIVLAVAALISTGWAVPFYVLGWLLIPAKGQQASIASRAKHDSRGVALALALASVLAVFLFLAGPLNDGAIETFMWPQVISVAGLTLIWRNAPDGERAGMQRLVQPLENLGPNGSAARRGTRLRIAGAAVLLVVGLGWLLSLHGGTQLLAPLGGFLLVAAALVLLLGPWWLRIARDLVNERQARARAEERSDIAARVHDSVLQTLALIQRRAEDPQAVVQLARAQERELRSWLFEGRAPGDADVSSLAEGVRQIQRDVEARYGVPVEVVTVADCPLDEHLSALLAAAQGGDRERGQVVGGRRDLGIRRGGAGQGQCRRAGPGQGIRPGRRPRRPQGRRGVHQRPDEPARRRGDRAVGARGGDEGDANDAAEGAVRACGTGAGAGRRAGAMSTSGAAQAAARPGGPPRVVLVDDHGLFRSGVRAELGTRVEVVGEAEDVAPAIELIGRLLPDVVLLDVHLPGGGGHAVITEVKKEHPDVRFLALSASDAPEDVIAVIRAGARGYVTKTISTSDLADAIRRVADGDAVFSHRLAGFVLDAFASAPSPDDVKPSFDPELDQLTTREREVLRLIAQGYTYKEIARELFISGKTVESHVSSVLRKLQLSSRHQLTRWAAERRLT